MYRNRAFYTRTKYPQYLQTSIGLLVTVMFAAVILIDAQDLPRSIRGYRVHDEIIKLSGNSGGGDGPYITVGRPRVSDISFRGVTLAIAGELGDSGREGRVEMLTFRDFRVNGIPFDIAEYNTPFELKKSGNITLPAQADVFLPTGNILNAAWNELAGSKKEWSVKGRVFVFGRFKKFGFHFKRVIPVDVDLTIKNPLIEYREKVRSARPS